MPFANTEPPIRVLERQFLPGLLGLRFWDVAASAPVQDGLLVQARSKSGMVVDAVQNRSGVWHFPMLPGVNSFDVGKAVLEGTPLAPLSRSLTVRVADTARRFQTVEFDAIAPIEGGLFDWPHGPVTSDDGSPLGSGPVPLFSRASRLAPPGHLSVRADLWDVEGDRAAAWALLEITVAGPWGPLRFLGLADERGSAVVFLPVPFVPVDGTHLPAAQRTWDVSARVAYAPAFTIDAGASSAELPPFEGIVAQHGAPDARIFLTRSPDTFLASATPPGRWREPLSLLEPLILRTEPARVEARLRSFLLIQPAP
ncbi:MAG TPA: hypothetical protein VER96_25710 [Polyangiaceae bacterium]|nr:hypothetical protein [Polyangiaceae bacterium]